MSTSKEAFLLHLHKRNPTSMDMMDRMVQKSDSETSHFVGIIWCSSLRKAVFMSYLNVFSKFHGNPFHRCWVVLVWTKAVGRSAESFGFRGEQEFLPGRTSSRCTGSLFVALMPHSSCTWNLNVISAALDSQSSVDRYTFLIRLPALRSLSSFHLFNRCRNSFLVWQKPPCVQNGLLVHLKSCTC